MKQASKPAAKNVLEGGVSIRMYRQGLGDCFLLTFHRGKQGPFYMLIDCGVILGTPKSAFEMQRVAQGIYETTRGRIDLLVVTHEHWDHISGFVEAWDVFRKFRGKIGNFWLGWTEKPDDEAAKQLQSARRRRAAALFALSSEYRGMSRAPGFVGKVDSLLAFHGPAPAAAASKTADALTNARAMFDREPTYCRPGGAPVQLRELPGVRFYILGPPADAEDIRKTRPSSVSPETYQQFDRLTFTSESAFFAAALANNESKLFQDRNTMEKQARPFATTACIPEDAVIRNRRSQLSAELRDAAKYWRSLYRARGERWRVVDEDWLNAASLLALQLDGQTNNTSLAMAIELADGKVLLFPGDAQVGRWRSWHKLKWTIEGRGEPRKIDMQSLLKRTIFYKVSHHGSHNATLKDLGLRMMTSEDLVAMIPVNEKAARKTKHWDMPFLPLAKDLKRRARRRVVLISAIRGPAGPPATAPKGVTGTAWRRFRKSLRETALFWEYDIALTRSGKG
jgi:hypothetical protein